jgi:hypothetical protein
MSLPFSRQKNKQRRTEQMVCVCKPYILFHYIIKSDETVARKVKIG